jgi:DNA repair exonuclease SbcCD ATPase subunit
MLIAQHAEQAVSNVDKPKPEQLGPENNEELFRLQSFSKDLKAKYDHFKQEAVRKTRELEQKLDKLKDLEAEGHTHEEDDTPVMSTIRQLENRFDKALIKYNEAASIGKTYEQIVRRHGEEKMDFDRQLALVEKALRQKEKDLVQLTLMSHDAIAAKEMAKSELSRVEKEEAAARAKRKKELKDRRDMVRQREDINAQLAARAAQREEDAQRAEEARKHKALMSDKASKEEYERAKKEKEDRMRAYEDAFFKIKEATGVSDISSVMDKFMTQEDTNVNLKLLTTEGQAKLDALQAARKEARTALEEYRFSGGGGGGGRRIVDEYESSLVDGINNNERVRAKFEKVHRVLVSMKSGTEHLMDTLDVVDGVGAPPPDVVSDETVVEVLAACEQKLL